MADTTTSRQNTPVDASSGPDAGGGPAGRTEARLDALTARLPALREFGYRMRRYRRTWRGSVVISVVNPLLFLAAMGAGLGRLVDANHSAQLAGTPYLHFLAPGLLAASAMQNAYIEGAYPVYQSALAGGNYPAAAATSMRPGDIAAGHLLFIGFRVLISGALFLAVVLAFGVVGPLAALATLGPVLLTGAAFATPLAALAVTVRRQSRLNGLYRFVVMPLYMFSGTFFPIGQLPHWLRVVAQCTPLYQVVQLTRGVALGTAAAGPAAAHTAYLLLLTAAGVVLTHRAYGRRLHR